jgi:hypothetical protein
VPNFLCTACGAQHAESDHPPAACAICQDERQYVKATGQQWTGLDRLRLTHRNSLNFKEPGLLGVGVEPHFAIGQRALSLRTPKANVLWDCLPLLDEAVAEAVQALGGISAVAISQGQRRVWSALLLAQVEPDRAAPVHRLALAILPHPLGPCHDQIGPPVAVPVADAEPLHVGRGFDEELPLGQSG